MGCTASKPAAPEAPTVISARVPALQPQDSTLVKLPSGGFACEVSPLFKEYLGLLGDGLGKPADIGEITSDDALLVIDMQRDFVPKSSTNSDGGRFGVAEGDHIIPLCEQLIEHVRKPTVQRVCRVRRMLRVALLMLTACDACSARVLMAVCQVRRPRRGDT